MYYKTLLALDQYRYIEYTQTPNIQQQQCIAQLNTTMYVHLHHTYCSFNPFSRCISLVHSI